MMITRTLTRNKILLHTAMPTHLFGSEKPTSYYYKVLGLEPGFSDEQLKNAYLEKVKKYHPDLSNDPNAEKKFQEIQEAYDILQDPSKRPRS